MKARRPVHAVVCLVAVAMLALAAGCGATERHAEGPEAQPTPASPLPPAPPPVAPLPVAPSAPQPPPASPAPSQLAGAALCLDHGTVRGVGDQTVSYAAVSRRPTEARRTPSGRAFASFGLVNDNGHAMVFEIRGEVEDGCGRTWYDAALPVRPNGVHGFIAARDVDVLEVHTRIVVDLSERTLAFFNWDEKEIETPIAIGAPGTPTPTGRYYVNQRLISSDPNGPWGPAAIGISAFSDVLQEWSQGGPIGIHGTNEPSSIGHAVSHGCIRLPNATLRKVFSATPAGTPVIIHP